MASEIVLSGTKKDIIRAIAEMEFEPNAIYIFKGGVQGAKYSLNALSYCWLLMDRIAKHPSIDSTKQEVYMSMLVGVGNFVYLPVLPENVESIKSLFRIVFDRGDIVMTTASGKQVWCKQLQCYKGLSAFDSREMAKFIDEVVKEAKALGIKTETPDEIARMKQQWGEK